MTTPVIIGGYFMIIILSALAIKMKDKKKTRKCEHSNKYTNVIEATLGCETTVQVCLDCNEVLTEPKTDCR